MCNSNYPPGVDGQESYFASVNDNTLCVECGQWFNDNQDGADTCPGCVDSFDGDNCEPKTCGQHKAAAVDAIDRAITDGVARDIDATLTEDGA